MLQASWIRRICLFVLSGVVLLSGFLLPSYLPVEGAESADRVSFIMLDAEMGQILERQNAEEITSASMLARLMTCLLTLEQVSVTEMTTPSSNSTSLNGKYELSVSTSYSYDALLKAVLLGNADNAARVLAESVNANNEYFVSLMNERAQAYGMTNTFFTNVDGAKDSLQRTTVHDMALFLQNALRNPSFKAIYCSSAAIIWDATVIVNENSLVLEHDDGTSNTVGGTCAPRDLNKKEDLRTMTFYYQTGSSEMETTMKLLLVMAEVKEEDHSEMAHILLESTLEKYQRSVLLPTGHSFLSLPVGEEMLELVAAQSVYCIRPTDVTDFIQNISYTYLPNYDPSVIAAPIEKGTEVGTAHILLKDGTLLSCPMVAETSLRAVGNPVQSLFSVLQEQKGLLIMVAVLLVIELLLVLTHLFWCFRKRIR